MVREGCEGNKNVELGREWPNWGDRVGGSPGFAEALPGWAPPAPTPGAGPAGLGPASHFGAAVCWGGGSQSTGLGRDTEPKALQASV